MKKLRERLDSLIMERAVYDATAKKISDYIAPGRNVHSTFTRPQIKKTPPKNSINPAAEDATEVLVSGIQAGLVSPSRPWFKLYFPDKRLRLVKAYTDWLYRAERVIYDMLSASNFYATVPAFFSEVINFGTGPIYIGGADRLQFRVLTWGEYYIDVNAYGEVDTLFRIIYLTLKQLQEKYGSKLPSSLAQLKKPLNNFYFTVIEAVIKEKYQDKPYKSTHFLYNAPAGYALTKSDDIFNKPLRVRGYYEFPYPTARWSVIGADVYGTGIGAKVLSTVQRLQEHEKSLLMMVHKEADPPMNVPVRLKGSEDFYPGGRNYYSNPQMKAEEVMRRSFNYQGIIASIQRIEDRIAKAYYNDIFLTAARDPNASPYKAAEVNAREAEKTLRLGPSIEMLGTAVFKPLLTRVFNIGLRKGLIPPPPEALVNTANYGIDMIGVLAQAQKAMGVQPMLEYIQMVTAVGQLDTAVIDKVDTDALHDEFADIKGIPSVIIRSKDDVQKIRENRAKAMQEQKDKEDALLQAQLSGQQQQQVADTAKTMSEASANYSEVLG